MTNPIIDKALERLPGNWIQGSYSDDEGEKYCLFGHIDQATNDATVAGRYIAAWSAIKHVTPGGLDPVAYNDLPSTSEEDIILLLKRANEVAS